MDGIALFIVVLVLALFFGTRHADKREAPVEKPHQPAEVARDAST